MNKIIATLNHVTFSVPFHNQSILNNISFSIQEGDFIILLGHNGSGKSSLIKLLNRTKQPTKGNIKLLNKPLKQYKHSMISKKIITLTQNIEDSLFTNMTIEENGILLEMRTQHFFEFPNKTKQIALLKKDLARFHKPFLKKMHTPVNQLSGGERQMLILALCLRHHPELILLDEHTSALDPKTSKMIMEKTYQIISSRHIACVMTTHNLDFALRYGNRLIAIKEGQIVHDVSYKQKSLLTRSDLLEDCY